MSSPRNSPMPGIVPPSTCPHCGAPLRCCQQGRGRGATGHGEPAEGRDGGAAAERATRELLALQASDWAFLDRRRQAGDYPWQRTTDHARALLESIHVVDDPPAPRLRNLAPDLSLAPMLEA